MPKGVYNRNETHLERLKEMRLKIKGIKYKKDAYKDRSLEKHHNWRGEKAKYSARHGRIHSAYGKVARCEMQDITCKGRFEWSCKDHKYSGNINDWQQLCTSHHKRYDNKKFGFNCWNKGSRIYAPVTCGWCKKRFDPDKKTSKFCSKSCAMFYRGWLKKEGLLKCKY